jgi:hypothetical protein
VVLAARARLLGASLATAGFAWLLWSGCGKAGANHLRTPPLDASADTDSGAGEQVADVPSEPATSDARPPYPGAVACPGLPGWYASPNMPAGCLAACIPDDVTVRVPALKSDARDDWCPGCKWLEPAWWPGATPETASPLAQDLEAVGSGPAELGLLLRNPDKSGTVGVWTGAGKPVAALRGSEGECAA